MTMPVKFISLDADDLAEAAENAQIAEISAGQAISSALAVASQVSIASSARTAAESARDAAQLAAGVYATTAAGLAAVADGAYFNVPSDDAAEFLILYRRSGAAALEIKRYPALPGILQIVEAARIQFEVDAERWFRPAFLTGDFQAAIDGGLLAISFSTSATTGSVYYVILPIGAPTPGRTQIKAGTDGSGVLAAASGSVAVADLDVAFSAANPLSGGGFDVYAFHERADGATSIRHKASFALPIIIASAATTGLSTGLTAVSGNITTAISDHTGQPHAVRITDSAPGTEGPFSVSLPVTYVNGLNIIRVKLRKITGHFDKVRVATANVTESAMMEINIATRAVTPGSLFTSIVVADLADGWFSVECRTNATGWADRIGILQISTVQGSGTNVTRDGTNVFDLNDMFVIEG